MSKTIGIKATYRNGVTVSRGLHCSNMFNSIQFSEGEITLLIKRFYEEIGTKRIKGSVVVSLNRSGETHEEYRDIRVEVSLLDLHLYTAMFSKFFE